MNYKGFRISKVCHNRLDEPYYVAEPINMSKLNPIIKEPILMGLSIKEVKKLINNNFKKGRVFGR